MDLLDASDITGDGVEVAARRIPWVRDALLVLGGLFALAAIWPPSRTALIALVLTFAHAGWDWGVNALLTGALRVVHAFLPGA